jgi:hypothetical protein
MPLLSYFHTTLRVFKTGSPSVRFYLFIDSVLCIFGGVVARHEVGKFTGVWKRCGYTCPYLPAPLCGYFLVSYFAAVVMIACNHPWQLFLSRAFNLVLGVYIA